MKKATNGFTLIEMLVVMAIVTLLVSIVIPALSHGLGDAKAAICLANLKQIVSGFHIYADDNDGRLPGEEIEMMWDELLHPYLNERGIYACPGDADAAELEAGISYAWRDTLAVDDPAASLSGRNLGTVSRGELVLVFDSIPGWHGETIIQAGAVDSSARRYDHAEFYRNLEWTVQ